MWVGFAACIWVILFATPHLWWAFGVSAAFLGGDRAYEFAFRNSLFLVYDLVVIILLFASALVALALVQKGWRRLFIFFFSPPPNPACCGLDCVCIDIARSYRTCCRRAD